MRGLQMQVGSVPRPEPWLGLVGAATVHDLRFLVPVNIWWAQRTQV